jgi:multiple antibiotic resistance protein
MSQADFAVNFFVALFALIDPIGNVPLFAAATVGAPWRERGLLAVYISVFAFGFLTFFFFTGLSLLTFFGISMAAFRIAGGLILLLTGLQMVRGEFAATFGQQPVDEGAPIGGSFAHARRRFERLVVPFAMPLVFGPGAISTVIIYASQAHAFGAEGAAVGLGVMAGVCAATLMAFLATPLVNKLFGRIGMTIIVRVLGLILTALAVQFIITGLADPAIGLIRPEAATPYPIHSR